MNSATSEAPKPEALKPRRKWGWIFVVLFIVQAVLFLALIAHTSTAARRSQDLANSFVRSGDIASATTDNIFAQAQRRQVNTLMIAFGIVSLICIGGAVIGFQRKK